MKQIIRTTLLLAALSFGASGTAHAQGAGGNFGIGGTIGDPFGFTAKLRTDSGFALQFLAGWSGWGYGGYWDGNSFQLSVDFLWDIDLKSLRRTEFLFYFGVGPQLEFVNWNNNPNDHSDLFVGVRVPLGLDWEFKSRPLDVFVEFAPGLLIGDSWDADNDTDVFFEGDFIAGARYWF